MPIVELETPLLADATVEMHPWVQEAEFGRRR